jgi:hypothetical protein
VAIAKPTAIEAKSVVLAKESLVASLCEQALAQRMPEVGRRLNGRDGGAQGRNRTSDTRIFSPLLYQLSYLG